jgi:hypothetical protein
MQPENWTSVASSHIDAIGWTPYGRGRLWVRFKGGKVVYYHQCPKSMFQDMLNAPSKGQWLHKNIKLPGIPFTYATADEGGGRPDGGALG